MEEIPLGTDGPHVSRLGLGGCPLGGHGWGTDFDIKEGERAVRRALELGVNFFDTADVYGLGRSEELLSRALGAERHRVTIATKFGVRWNAHGRTWHDLSPSYMQAALEASLRRLRVESISLYYAHWPDGRTPIEETIAALERCREEGKIQAIGVSNFSGGQLTAACKVAPISAMQVQCSLVDQEPFDSVRAAVRSLHVPLITWGSLAQGLLTGKYDSRSAFGADDRRHRYTNFLGQKFGENLRVVDALKQISRRIGKSPAQIAIRWLLDTQDVGGVLFGAKRPSQVEDNLGAIGWQLASDDYRLLAGSRDVQQFQAA
jgi:aryl-alcohol dehydrogenase-like predicted oxidoreductase